MFKRDRPIGGLSSTKLARKLELEESDPDEFDRWCQTLTGAERVNLVSELTRLKLRKEGITSIPRLNRRAFTIIRAPKQNRIMNMHKTDAAAEGFVTILKSLPKAQRDAVIVRIAQDEELVEDILDLATIASRRNEPSRPYREYRKDRKAR